MIPSCTTKNSLLACDLEAFAKHGEVERIRVVFTLSGSYVIAHISDEPVRPIYLATRRNRRSPKLFKDSLRLNERLVQIAATSPTSLEIELETQQTVKKPTLREVHI